MEPHFCQMIDIGTIPLKNSISQIVEFMKDYPLTGGACGEIAVFNPAVENKLVRQLDKKKSKEEKSKDKRRCI